MSKARTTLTRRLRNAMGSFVAVFYILGQVLLPVVAAQPVLAQSDSGAGVTAAKTTGDKKHKDGKDKINICHATGSTSNPYVLLKVDKNTADGDTGNNANQADHYAEHNGPLFTDGADDWGDIIPPIEDAHNGLNWTAAGQEIYNNDCDIPSPPVEVPQFSCKVDNIVWQALDNLDDLKDNNVRKAHTLYKQANGGRTVIDTGLSFLPGKVTIDKYVSWDGYKGREHSTQPHEQWAVRFVKNGSIVATSPLTQDLADKVVSDTKMGSLGQFNLPNGADKVLLVHVSEVTGAKGPNSVVPVALCLDYEPAPQNGNITVVKEVRNNDGGDAKVEDFNLYVNGNKVDSGETGAYQPGTYTVSEDQLSGYRLTSISCWDVTKINALLKRNRLRDEDNNRRTFTFTLEPEQKVYCRLINNDIKPSLTVVKRVINDNGGSLLAADFGVSVNGHSLGVPDATNNDGTIAKWKLKQAKANKVYKISEMKKPGYTLESIRCVDTKTDQPVPFPVILDEGQRVVCVLTNNDQPATLTVIKDVDNSWGGGLSGDDFNLYVGDTQVGNGQANEFDAGTYSVSEDQQQGYVLADILGDCFNDDGDISIKLEVGRVYTCVLENKDQPAQLKVKKFTLPAHSATDFDFEAVSDALNGAPERDYNFTLDTSNTDGDGYHSVSPWFDINAGSATVTETVPNGWYSASICRVFSPEDVLPDGGSLVDYIKDLVTGASYGKNLFVDFGQGEVDVSNINNGDKVLCAFVNVELPTVTVTKYHDQNQNGAWDEGEPTLPGWTFDLETCGFNIGILSNFDNSSDVNGDTDCYLPLKDGESMLPFYQQTLTETTGDNGQAVFGDNEVVFPFFTYRLSERVQEGWNLLNLECVYPSDLSLGGTLESYNSYLIRTLPGEDIQCTAGNYRDARLLIEKTNDTVDAVVPGTTVNYTITVTNPEDSGVVFNAEVGDVLPDNFTFNNAVSVISTVRGDITGSVSYSYTDGVGEWQIGNLAVGEVVTITYSVTVGADVSPGSYDNIAYVTGDRCLSYNRDDYDYDYDYDYIVPSRGLDLIQIDRGNNNVDFECAETQAIVGEDASPEVEDDVFAESTVKVAAVLAVSQTFVLGASTLANTGVPAILSPLAGMAVIFGALSVSGAGGRRFRRWLQKLLALPKSLLLALVFTLAIGGRALAAPPVWQLSVVDLQDVVRTDKVIVDYQIASIDSDANFSVTLDSDGPGSNDAMLGPTAGMGSHNGSFELSLPVDGEYKITVTADTGGDTKQFTQTVTRDATPPAAPDYQGSTRSGNAYTLKFSVSDPDAVKVLVYASTSKQFTADSNTLVATLNASDTSYVFNAPDSSQYYFAIQTQDAAGNVSPLVGDKETIASAGTGATATAGNGQVGATAATDSQAASNDQGEAQGATDTNEQAESSTSTNNSALTTVLVVVLAIAALYYVFGYRPGESKDQ